EIRVLRIKPAERFRDHLDSTIEYLCLDYNPEFEALSYTWGNFEHLGPRSYPLYINGDLFWIGESLDSALRHIRGHVQYEANDLLIWVDAVCIHQSHEAEKNWQVKQMRRAYSQASTVIIWLGPSAENSDTAMDALQSMMRCNYRDMLADLSALLARAWWGRIWVLQELAIAKRVTIVCGR
ncbi:heterokaryon incompatibility protein-domain-containing protein, partial [Leptodontidium sp. 2 PMI_412]